MKLWGVKVLEVLLSELLGERFYPEVIPSDAKLPGGAFTVREVVSFDSHDGATGALAASVLVRVVGETFDDCAVLVNEVLRKAEGWGGRSGGGYVVSFCDSARRGGGLDKDSGLFFSEVELELGLLEVNNG